MANLIPKWLLNELPSPGEGELARVRLHLRDGFHSWYVSERDPESGLLYGVELRFVSSRSSFRLEELEEHRGPLGLPVIRDRRFQPTPISNFI